LEKHTSGTLRAEVFRFFPGSGIVSCSDCSASLSSDSEDKPFSLPVSSLAVFFLAFFAAAFFFLAATFRGLYNIQ
jgi:hypothetical protein